MNPNVREIKTFYTHKFYEQTGKQRRATCCGIYDPEIRMMIVDVALCSHKDTFKKKIGRLISEGRARKRFFNSRESKIYVAPNMSPGKAFIYICEKLFENT